MKAMCKIAAITLVAGWAATAQAGVPVVPGEIIYDFTTNGYVCDPDDWNFFGPIVTDFGWDDTAEDGSGAFIAGDWIGGGWGMGSGVGIGPFAPGQPLCGSEAPGRDDIDLDVTQGTGLSMRLRLELPPGDLPPFTQGTPGARVQFQLMDPDGTVAVLPGLMSATRPYVNRMYPPSEDWQTFTFFFAGLDSDFDDAAVAGSVPGIDLTDLEAMQLIVRPGPDSQNVNVLHFDEITLINEPLRPWADDDADGDVDLADFAVFQACFGADLTPTHPEVLLFDFEDGDQGWASFGAYGTDSGLLVNGSVGQGRYHVADFDINTNAFGIVDVSPTIDLSAFTGLKFDARMVDVAGQTPFGGPREFNLVLGIGETEFVQILTATTDYQTFEVAFADMTPPPAPFHLADPALEIRLVVLADGKSGVVELDYDEFVGVETVEAPCKRMDANYDEAIDDVDFLNFADCLLGPGVTDGFYSWCY